MKAIISYDNPKVNNDTICHMEIDGPFESGVHVGEGNYELIAPAKDLKVILAALNLRPVLTVVQKIHYTRYPGGGHATHDELVRLEEKAGITPYNFGK